MAAAYLRRIERVHATDRDKALIPGENAVRFLMLSDDVDL